MIMNQRKEVVSHLLSESYPEYVYYLMGLYPPDLGMPGMYIGVEESLFLPDQNIYLIYSENVTYFSPSNKEETSNENDNQKN